MTNGQTVSPVRLHSTPHYAKTAAPFPSDPLNKCSSITIHCSGPGVAAEDPVLDRQDLRESRTKFGRFSNLLASDGTASSSPHQPPQATLNPLEKRLDPYAKSISTSTHSPAHPLSASATASGFNAYLFISSLSSTSSSNLRCKRFDAPLCVRSTY
ncbi:uncharacterized protein LOC121996031 [Zingiber officinale]|uniref:uncharacterized protein LOC121996031 n=1 Tax=Zingiber officinale TaxID=94328 RepID=UPI001C4D4888|nr:uncharacterized protein LOC121996031 [Zingiber officinale]